MPTLGRTKQGLQFQPPKTNAGRCVIDLDEGTVELLRSQQRARLLLKAELGKSYEDRGLVFAGPLGDPINPMALTRTLQSFAKQVGVEGIKSHTLRHFHASLALQTGQSIVLVSKRLGHSKTSITGDIYGHLLPGWQKQAAEAFAKVMKEAD